MSTFVSVGNATQSFVRLIDAVLEICSQLPQPVTIQYGNSRVVNKNEDCNWKDFLSMNEFEEYIKNSELLIMHAGAGSLINAIKAGKVPVIVPRRKHLNEHIDDHQLEFAEALANEDKAVLVIHDSDLLNGVEQAKYEQNNNKLDMTVTPRLLDLVNNAILEKG